MSWMIITHDESCCIMVISELEWRDDNSRLSSECNEIERGLGKTQAFEKARKLAEETGYTFTTDNSG